MKAGGVPAVFVQTDFPCDPRLRGACSAAATLPPFGCDGPLPGPGKCCRSQPHLTRALDCGPHSALAGAAGLDTTCSRPARLRRLAPRPWETPPLSTATAHHPELVGLARYSTVTDFAKFRGWSTSVPFSTAT